MAAAHGQTTSQFHNQDQPPKLANRRPDWDLPDLQLDLRLSSHDPLHEAQKERIVCPTCSKRRSLYCYDCLVPLTPAPTLRLPCKVSIITHHEEARSKNTGVQAAILAPQDVTLHSVEQCPDFDPNRAVVLFPSQDATLVSDLDFSQVDRVFIIDSRWKKAKTLVGESSLAAVRHVALRDTHTAFWRFHTNGVSDEGVCTIEALYYFFKQLGDAGRMQEGFAEPHCFDDLLWYFVYQHQLVRAKATERYQQRVGRKDQVGKGASSKGSGEQHEEREKQHQPQQLQSASQACKEEEQSIEPHPHQKQHQQQQPRQGDNADESAQANPSKKPRLEQDQSS